MRNICGIVDYKNLLQDKIEWLGEITIMHALHIDYRLCQCFDADTKESVLNSDSQKGKLNTNISRKGFGRV
jgi:hypothetical protein